MNTPRDPRDYHINQVSQSSSLEEVRLDGTPPAPRLVEMRRDPVLGFGFVAGSEKPVVVRSVTPGGPSEGKLIAGDEIIMINDEEVSSAPRERVIDLVRSCKESIMLTVVQPYPSPKSAFISAAKKAKLKSNPVKVRFAEEVIINGQVPNSVKDSSLLFMPNVLKVYLENGQTKSFRFDCSTSIKVCVCVCVERPASKGQSVFQRRGGGTSARAKRRSLGRRGVTRRPGADKMKCFFRISFVPRDPVELLRRDAVAFEYLYVQCCNDVVLERFGAELKYDAALRLAALQMYIITMTTRQSQKVSLKYIQKEWGLPLFLPPAVMASMKEKNIKKALTHILKTNHNLVPAGKRLTVLQAKVHYLRYLSELQLYGGREFKSILLQGEKQTEVLLLVGPRYGISHVINARTNLVALLADFSHVNRIEILTEDEANVRLELHVLDVRPITLIMESSDAMNLACLTAGYYRLLVDSRRSIFNMAQCNSMQGEDAGHDRILEWPYSPSLGDGEEEPLPRDGKAYYRHSDYNDNGQRGNARISPYFHSEEPDGGDDDDDGGGGRGGDPGGRRSPLPPPLPPSTRHKPQDSPRSAKVSFIFGGAPPRNARGNAASGYDRPLESPDVPAHRPPYLHHNVDFGSSQPFHYGGGGGGGGGVSHVYSNIGGEEGNEEPLLRDLCYADTTDDAEDEDDASCEEDSTGGTPVNDEAGNGNGNRVPNCLNLMMAQGGLAAAAGKTTFLALSGSVDDIIDLTALPPPEGDDAVAVDDDDDTVLETLNLAIAAPPPGFRDGSDEDAALEGRPLSTPDNDDIPVSLIDSVPTREDSGEGSRGGAERRLENAVANTLQALEALSVAEQRPPPRPHAPRVRTSRGLSPESSSDSGNETNSSEMTEISELAAAHRLHESHMRLLVATREGYQPLLEEKTEFPVSPSAGETLQQKACSPSRHLLQPPAVPLRRTPLLDPAMSGPDSLQVGAQAGNCSSSTLQRPSSVTPGGKHHKKSGDSSGKYNTFSTRDGHWGAMGGSIGLLELDRGAEQGGSNQRRQNSLMVESSVADGLGVNSLPRGYRGLPQPPPPSTSNRSSDESEFRATYGATDNGASAIEQDEHLAVASLLSPTEKPLSAGSDLASDVPSDHPPISRQQSVARLCEYHLAKRISSLQGEAHNSLQGSLCSSLDAGGSMNGSVGGTPTDSPLGSKHQHQQHHHHHHQRHPLSSSSSSLLRAVNYEDSKSAGGSQGVSGQNKELHPHADPAMLRKMLPNIHPPVAGSEPPRPSSATPSKHKETSAGQRVELSTIPLGGRGDNPSAFTRQASAGPRACLMSPSTLQLSIPPPPPPPPPPATSPQPIKANNCFSHSGSLPRQDSLNPMQYRPSQNHIQPVTLPRQQTDPFHNSLQRGRELQRSSSHMKPGSGSVEALFEKPVRSRSQQPLVETKAPNRRPTRKRLSKSYSQGSVCSQTTCWSTGSRGGTSRRASVAFPLQKDGKHLKGSQKLDASPWRCNGPFSYCFFKKRSEVEEDEVEWEGQRQSRNPSHYDIMGGSAGANVMFCGSSLDTAGEQLYGEIFNNMSFSDRLARINTLKDRMYVLPGGFTDVRRDASELIALVRSSVGRGDRGPQMPPIQDLSQYKQLLSIESKELGRACRRMAQAHGSPEEMLLAVTCSFQVLCCLCEACMCLVRGLGAAAAHQQREVVAKVDEVVMNYICLLKAAETATVGAPGEHSVKALVRHSSTMTSIANALTRSLKTLISK
ncbi:unnamed protein product [Lota lota]